QRVSPTRSPSTTLFRSRVDSAVVRLTPWPTPPYPASDFRLFRQMVNQAFTQRRKVISNALKSWLTAEQICAAGVDPGIRPDAIRDRKSTRLNSSHVKIS